MIIVMGYFSCFISPNLCRGGRRGVWFRVPYDVPRKHNRDRVADIPLSSMGMICDYVDRAYN